MKLQPFILSFITILFLQCKTSENKEVSVENGFDINKDLLLLNYDCKTDVDDLHSIAAFVMMTHQTKYANVNYYAVAGTYGIQKGLYVSTNELFNLAFEDRWSDAHKDSDKALKEVLVKVKTVLHNGGNIFIAEAGQSDFSAKLIKKIKKELIDINTKKRFKIVQHSDWNEKKTTPELLSYVKQHTAYEKIEDGNKVGNGTPGFKSTAFNNWQEQLKNTKLERIWTLAKALSDEYNGKDERYLNKAMAAGELDFSDLSEVCWILGEKEIIDAKEFFKKYAK